MSAAGRDTAGIAEDRVRPPRANRMSGRPVPQRRQRRTAADGAATVFRLFPACHHDRFMSGFVRNEIAATYDLFSKAANKSTVLLVRCWI
jgi:hypothetical protein